MTRGRAARKLVGLITRRSLVQIQPPQPEKNWGYTASVFLFQKPMADGRLSFSLNPKNLTIFRGPIIWGYTASVFYSKNLRQTDGSVFLLTPKILRFSGAHYLMLNWLVFVRVIDFCIKSRWCIDASLSP